MSERFRLKQDGMVVASAEGSRAAELIAHYALVYGQDGPVKIERLVRGRWRPTLEPSPHHAKEER